MTDRIVRTTLQLAVSNYLAGMEKVAKATARSTTEAERLSHQGEAFSSLGVTAMKMGAVIGVGLAIAITRFAEFDQAMSQVQAATQASAADMDVLRDAALDAGAKTVYTAAEAANAIEELGKAGLTTAEIVGGGLSGALTLAAAGGIEVADAATYMATSLKQFGRNGDEASHVADLLAAGAGKAVGDVEDLAQALNQAGLIANGAGFSIEETTGVLAAFADAGLLGSDAGTALKTAIVALQAPTGKAAELLEKYKINVYDANGEMLGFADIAGQLETKMGNLDDKTRNAALATIFGTDAIRAANVLYSEGASGIQKYIDQTNDSGYAAKVAADRLNNLSGDVEKLGGSFDTALIKTGSGANDVLRQMVQSATFLVDAFGSLPEPVLAVGFAFTAVTASVLLTGGAMLQLPAKFTALKATITATGVSMGGFAIKTAAIGGAIGLATIAVGFFIAKQAEAAATTSELKESLDETSGAATNYTRELIAKKLAESGAFDSAKNLGISQKELTDAVLEGGDALDDVNNKLGAQNNIVDFFNGSGIAAGNAKVTIKELSDGLADSKENFKDEAAAADESGDSTQAAAESYQTAADNAAGLTENLLSLIDTINKANGVGQDAITANNDYQNALAAVDEQIRKATLGIDENKDGVADYVNTLDRSTQAGRDNEDMLVDLAKKSQEAAKAQLALDGDTDSYLATVDAGRQKIIDNALALGATAEQAQTLADKIYAIPTAAEIKLIVDTAAATTAIQDFLNATKGIKIGVGLYANKSLPLADGGAVEGVGGPRQDNIPIMGSVGEHMLDAEDVRRMGGQAGVYAFRRGLYSGGYADGGAIEYATGPNGGGASTVVQSAPALVSITFQDGLAAFKQTVQAELLYADGTTQRVIANGKKGNR